MMCAGPGGARAAAVVDGHADPAQLHHPAHQRNRLTPFLADRPRASGNLQQHRGPVVRRDVGAPPDVEQVVATVGAVRDVAGADGVAAALGGAPDADDAMAPHRRVGDRVHHLIGVIRAVRLDEGLAQHRVGALGGQPAGEPVDRCHIDRRQRMPGEHQWREFGRQPARQPDRQRWAAPEQQRRRPQCFRWVGGQAQRLAGPCTALGHDGRHAHRWHPRIQAGTSLPPGRLRDREGRLCRGSHSNQSPTPPTGFRHARRAPRSRFGCVGYTDLRVASVAQLDRARAF